MNQLPDPAPFGADFAEKVIAALAQDITPLLPAEQYPSSDMFAAPFEDSLLQMLGRDKYLAKYGHVLLSRECVDAVVKVLRGRRVLDVCAGGGFLAYTLANEGVDIQAVDLHPPPPEPTELDCRTRWQIDFAGSALDLPLSEYDILLMVWPDHGDPFADQVAAAMRPGQILVYQGEGKGAATASNEFFERICDPNWRLLESETRALNQNHVRFRGINDRWWMFERMAG